MRTKTRQHVWAAFLHAHAAVVEAIEDDLRRDHGLPLVSYEVLMRLDEAPSARMRMQDLAELVLLSKSGLTRLVDRLEQAGFVRRRDCDRDRRVTYAVLTERGRGALSEARPCLTRAVDRHFARHLTAEEADVLLEVFRRLLAVHDRRHGLGACGGC